MEKSFKLKESYVFIDSSGFIHFKPSPRVCLVLVDTVRTVPVVSGPTGVEQLLLSAVCLVQEAIATSGACCRCSFPCCQLIFHDSRHAAHDGSRKSNVFISSHRMNEKKLRMKRKKGYE